MRLQASSNSRVVCSNLGAGPATGDALQKQVQMAMGNATSVAEANRAEAERVLGSVKDQMGSS